MQWILEPMIVTAVNNHHFQPFQPGSEWVEKVDIKLTNRKWFIPNRTRKQNLNQPNLFVPNRTHK